MLDVIDEFVQAVAAEAFGGFGPGGGPPAQARPRLSLAHTRAYA